MKKLLSNKWGKFLLVSALTLLFFLLTFIITASVVKESGTHNVALGACFVYVSIPVLYFVTVLLNYLRFALTKLIRWILFIASMAFAVGGLIAVIVGNFDGGHVLSDPAGYAFCYGMATGSLVTWTLLFFDFRKMGHNPENAEKRSWLQNVIIWSIYFVAPFIGLGLLYLIVHAINKTFVLVIVVIAIVLLTAGSVYKSISTYGNPLGSSKEWDEWVKKHPISVPTGGGSSSSGGSFEPAQTPSKQVLSGDIYHKIIGMYHGWVEISSAGVYENCPNDFNIELTLRDTYNGNDKGDNWNFTLEHHAKELINEVGNIVSKMGAKCQISAHFE